MRNMKDRKDLENKYKIKRTVVYDLQIIGEITMNGLIHALEETIKEAYPDKNDRDQVKPEDGIFWGNVPQNLWYLLDLFKEARGD